MIHKRKDAACNRLQRELHRWHRRLGVIAATFVSSLAASGLLLSHAAALRLDARIFDAAWLVRLYGMTPRSPPRALASAAGTLVWIDGNLYRDGALLDAHFPPVLGAAETADTIVVAGRDTLLLLSRDGRLLERIDAASLPGPIDAIGCDARGRITLRSGETPFATDDFLRWSQAIPVVPVHWSVPDIDPIPARIAPALRAFRGPGVSAARIVTDLHTGRFLGPIGPWLVDASAIALLVLSGSGIWMWAHRRRLRHR